MIERLKANPVATAVGFVLLAAAGGWLLYLFQPWQHFVDTAVDEDFPPVPGDSPVPDDMMDPDEKLDEPMPPDGPVVLRGGSFRDRSHPASGMVTLYRLEDGSITLRFEGLETDNGPDLFVYLSNAGPDAPAGEFDEDFVNLGRLKGNIGNQNYEVPADLDLDHYTTVAIWCDRFDVVFGTAPLAEVRADDQGDP